MNHEVKLLGKKLMALLLSLTLVLGLCPGKVFADEIGDKEFSFELLDYEETYYNGFNSNVCVATGTYIQLNYGDQEAGYLDFDKELVGALAKDSEVGASFDITLDDQYGAEAQVYYEDGDVKLSVIYEGEELYNTVLYTPKYVELSEMPTIALDEEVTVANGAEKYCEQYYRVDVTDLPNIYKTFTIVSSYVDEEDGEEYDEDTYLFLYNAYGRRLKKNDEAQNEADNINSAITFKMAENSERIIGVRGYGYAPITDVKLALVQAAKHIVSFASDNIDQLNVFYEGFNDQLLYATGTRIVAKLDNDQERVWQSEGQVYEYDEDLDLSDIEFGEVEAYLYRKDGGIYANYGLPATGDAYETKLFYTPVIKQVSDIPAIEEGDTDINTLPWAGAYSYYRITAEKDEVWTLKFAYAGEDEQVSKLRVRNSAADGTALSKVKQTAGADLEVTVEVPAGETRVISVFDLADASQPFTLTVAKEIKEETTTPEETSTEASGSDETTTEAADVTNEATVTTTEEAATTEVAGTDAATTEAAQTTEAVATTTQPVATDATTTEAAPTTTETAATTTEPVATDATTEVAPTTTESAPTTTEPVATDATAEVAPTTTEAVSGSDIGLQLGENGVDKVGPQTVSGDYQYQGGFYIPENVTGDYTILELTYKGDISSLRLEGGGKTLWFAENEGGTFQTVDGSPIVTKVDDYTTIQIDLAKSGVSYNAGDFVHLHAGNGTEFTYEIKDVKLKKAETATTAPETTTTARETTTVAPTTTSGTTAKIKVGKPKLKKNIRKKKSAKKIKITLKKLVKKANGYEIRVFKTRKNAKKHKKAIAKKTIKKNKKKLTIKNKKLKGKKKLYVRVRAYRIVGGKKYTGKWSVTRLIKLKK